VIIDFELYRSTTSQSVSHGLAFVNPGDTAQFPEDSLYRRFERVEEKDYYVYGTKTEKIEGNLRRITLPFVQLFFTLEENKILAYYAEVERKIGGVLDTVYIGSIDTTSSSTVNDITFLLKLLKPESPKPEDITWEYEWRNVYFLKSRPIDKDGLKIDVYKSRGREDISVDPNHQDGVRYLQLLKLDRYDQSGNEAADGIIDFSQIDFEQGLLFFPDRHPFDLDTLTEKVSPIYQSNLQMDRSQASTYYINVESKSRKSEYNLHSNIIEGSELVTINGNPLARGRDYQIDYQIGTISFLTEQASDPTADIKVDYEYAPFIMADKKSLYGLQADYTTERGLRLNSVVLYKSEKSYDQKPRVGEEPKRNFVWGVDLIQKLTPPVMTRMVDALPLYGTEEPSTLDLTLKVAQSIPNPNLKNEAYIDDFESSRQYTDLSVLRHVWTLSSLPRGDWQRARMIWYNPYDQVRLQDIWPNYQVQEKDRLTHILNLVLYPDRPHAPIDTTNGKFDPVSIGKSCNGIMRDFGPGSWNQTKTRFLEIWLKTDWRRGEQGKNGVLRIDLGEISEDINADDTLNTEDREVNGQRNGILEEDEDTGLDGIKDDSNNIDWSGDNWAYDASKDKNDYSQINGTEGNKDDGVSVYKIDTEDINSNDILDKTNNYYEFTIDLNDTSSSPYYISGSYPTGWVLYRIPLQEIPNSNKIEEPNLSYIKFARIWLSPSDQLTTDSVFVQIASVELVGNRWQSAGIIPMYNITDSSVTRNKLLPVDDKWVNEYLVEDTTHGSLEVFVINTYENQDYTSPPGVAGEVDRYTDVRQREQSLVLKYQDIEPGYLGMAERYLYGYDNYTNYQRLKMFVHGPSEGNAVKFFYRMGTNQNIFYEYQTYIYPGWDPRNEVNIDFSQITALKNYMLINATRDSVASPDTIIGNYRIKGNPSLGNIRWFAVGVYNDTLFQDSTKNWREISGEIWVNELKVTDVRKVAGWTYAGNISAKFADLATLAVTYSQKDSEFRGLADLQGSGTNSTAFSMSFDTHLERFLPTSWGLNLPFSVNYSKTLSLPRLKPGSDIVLPSELRNNERSESVTKRLTFNPQFTRNTNNWLVKLTLKRLSLNPAISYSRTDTRIPNVPVSWSKNYQFGFKYDMTPGKNVTVLPFKGFASVFLLKKLASETITFLPSNLIFTSLVKGGRSYSQSNVGNITTNYYRDLIGNIDAMMSPLKTVKVSYKFKTSRDIRYNKDIKFALIPKKAKLGIEINRDQSFAVNYDPKWLEILDPSFAFTSYYKENADPKRYQGTMSVGNTSNKNASFTFYWQKIFGILKPKEKKEAKNINPLNWIREFVGGLSYNLQTLNINYRIAESSSKSGLLKRPSLAYQFGFTHEANVPLSPDPKFSTSDGRRTSKLLDLSSGLKISTDISISSIRYSRIITTTLASGKPVRNIDLIFPDMRVTWNRLESLIFFKRFAASANYAFGFKKEVKTTEDGITYRPTDREIITSFSPLVSLTMTLKNKVQTNFNLDRQATEKRNLSYQEGGIEKSLSTSETYTVNTSYSFSAPKGLKLPFLKKIKFRSTLNLSLSISLRNIQSKNKVRGKGYVMNGDSKEFSLMPRASYSFSSQVNGGLSGRWADSKN
ncbi:MAG: cell surface protein SprA, partial [candidate division Zixibacteria bacterium]|nr:cell surface protein SprA [candidate division Zixibacteria bacterium]